MSLTPELTARIHDLKARENLSVREIARRLKLGRDTVAAVLRGQTPAPKSSELQRRPPRFHKIEAYKPQVIDLAQKGLTAQRIFEAVQAQGYSGRYTVLREFVRALRHARKLQGVIRFEVPPGKQAQVDWSTYEVCFGPAPSPPRRRVYCFGYILSHSRVLYAEFFPRADFYPFLRGHVNAFAYTGGVPKEVLYDNLKSVVASRWGGFVRFNDTFAAFARYYGFEARACQVSRPQTKGRIERSFDYLFKGFLQGREFESLEDLNRQLKAWLDDKANRRVHGTTGRVPWEVLDEEHPFLLPLPAVPFDTSEVYSALCPLDGLVSFQGNRYSMPPTCAGKTVLIRATETELILECEGRQVARHERLLASRGQTRIDPAHYEGLAHPPRRARAQLLEAEFDRLGPKAAEYLVGLKRRYGQGALSHAAKILAFKLEYRIEDIHRALEKALGYDAFGASYVEGVLRHEAARRPDPAAAGAASLSPEEVARIQDWIRSVEVQKTPLDAYREFLKEGTDDGERSSGGPDAEASGPETDADGGDLRSGS